MKKGQLVTWRNTKCSPGDEGDTFLIVKGPYERAVPTEISGIKITTLSRCVDILLPSGHIEPAVSCDLLKRA